MGALHHTISMLNEVFSQFSLDFRRNAVSKIIENRNIVFVQLVSRIEILRGEFRKLKRSQKTGRKEISLLSDKVAEILDQFSTPSSFDAQFSGALAEIDRITESLPERFSNNQSQERFTSQKTDSVNIRVFKVFKSIAFKTETYSVIASNGVKRFMKKEETSLPIWTHDIPFRNVVMHQNEVFKDQLFKGLSSDFVYLADSYERLARLYKSIFEIVGAVILSEQASEANWNELTTVVIDDYSNELDELYSNVKKFELKLENDTKLLVESYLNTIQLKSELVDTVELSVSAYEPKKTQDRKTKNEKKFKKFYSKWQDFVPLQKNRWHIFRSSLNQLFLQYDVSNEFIELIRNKIDTQIIQNLKVVHDTFESEQERFNNVKEIKSADVESRREYLSELISNRLTNTASIEDSKLWFSESCESFKNKFLEPLDNLNEDIRLTVDRKFENGIPTYSTFELNWKTQIGYIYAKEIDKLARIVPEEYFQLVLVVKNLSAEIDQVIDVSINAALEADEYGESGVDIILDSVERIQDRIQKTIQKSEIIHKEIDQVTRSAIGSTESSILEMVFSDKIDDLSWKERENLVRERASDWSTMITVWQAKLIDLATIWVRFLSMLLNKNWHLLREFLGLTSKADSGGIIEVDISQFLSESRRTNAALPFVYRRLFSLDNVEEERVYVEPTKAFQQFKKAYTSWEAGNKVNIAVIGEPGSGKTFFMNQSTKKIGSRLIRMRSLTLESTLIDSETLLKTISKKLGIRGVQTPQNFIDAVRKNKNRTIVSIENIHQLFLRTPSGFNAIETLLLLINETRDQIFWIVSCSRFAWEYNNNVMRIREYFSYVAEIDKVGKDQVEEMILSRHKLSGFNLEFEAPPSIKKQRTYKKMLADPEKLQKYIRKKYFEDLTEFAEGNATIAILFWLISIVNIDESRVLVSSKLDRFDGLTNTLATDILFTYASLLMHDSLTHSEHAAVFNQSENTSRLLLSRMHTSGLLDFDGNTYKINDLILRPLVRALKLKNILH